MELLQLVKDTDSVPGFRNFVPYLIHIPESCARGTKLIVLGHLKSTDNFLAMI